MPNLRDKLPKTEILQLRLSPELRQKCRDAREKGRRKDDAEATFIAYLIGIGLSIYEKSILPRETGDIIDDGVFLEESQKLAG